MNLKFVFYVYIALLLLASFLPINGENSALNNNYTLSIRWDYLLHAIIYLPLPALLFALIRVRTNSPKIRINSRRTIIIIIALSMGTGLEILQMLIPYRSFNINDLIANGVGVLLGWILMMIVRKKLAFA